MNVVLGIRDDELAKLDIFKARIPGLFSNYLRLDLLDRDAARAAILGPLDRYNELADEPVAIEPELVETVLGEVAAGRIDPGLTGRGAISEAPEDRTRVETPYLQLVMQKLWEVERERRSPVLRLATLAELGGAQRIVEDHLEHAMAALTPCAARRCRGDVRPPRDTVRREDRARRHRPRVVRARRAPRRSSRCFRRSRVSASFARPARTAAPATATRSTTTCSPARCSRGVRNTMQRRRSCASA